ncbi:pre-rRNA processing protein FTSJ3 isoform X2 [Trichogramma pretiosum]|uniref:pre-rRNA processing protein FTSJ3 isoform X2 n=1 Tax=Trichogramma pretiosum TaxID=7493 RepID=UPI0006C9D027|nr:pre-rRNA processing protein FTSJ3 isoform X2 [Trichogramma pretiosum]
MGKKAKIGKQRRDKYYHLAKETGYRSRAAFKLIQLERKFEFLKRAKVCIDLCAAPGGWMQVAHEHMPMSSIVVGVDLFPIKPVPGCISIVGDITVDKTRVEISRELKTWKADVVLNDGAPNVGQNWLHDAYQQSTLTLSALKLATSFLRKGGWFVTKVFRSKDYLALVHNFKQLFQKVHATKPSASRNESAEIFVVCQGYIGTPKVDPKLLDPKYVFAEAEEDLRHKYNIYAPEKQKKAKAIGYEDGDYTQFHKVSVKDYIAGSSAVETLQYASQIAIDDERILNHPKTTTEIKECCKDIKVLGKKDMKNLMAWWKAMKAEFGEKKVIAEPDTVEEIEPKTQEELEDEEDEQITQEIEKIKKEKAKELKKKKKKEREERVKLNKAMNLEMVHKGDPGIVMEADDMFSLEQIKSATQLAQVTDQAPDMLAVSDEESEDDEKVLPKYVKYEKDSGHLDSKGLFYKDDESDLEFDENDDDSDKEDDDDGFGTDTENDVKEEEDEEEEEEDIEMEVDDDEEEEEDNKEEEHPLITDLDYRDLSTKKLAKINMFFERDNFKDSSDEELVEDMDIDRMVDVYKKKGGKIIGDDKDSSQKNKKSGKSKYQSDDEVSDNDSDYNVDEEVGRDIKSSKNKAKNKKVGGKDGFEIVSKESAKSQVKKRKLTPEDLALGTMIAQGKKARRDITDAAWNRYAFNDDHLPDWFVEDEQKHMKKEIEIPEEILEDCKSRTKGINVRTSKKVMEAKARKKKRALMKMNSAKKRVENVMENVELSEREKARQVKNIYKKATQEPKKKVTYVVSKKHSAQKRVSRPRGVKGPYKVVDPRMKKDLRAAKNKEKTKGRGKRAPPPGRGRKNASGGRDKNSRNERRSQAETGGSHSKGTRVRGGKGKGGGKAPKRR